MIVCGVDDAGRGSVLGPLVIAGISIQRSKIKYLSKIGVRDSKQL
ncbi:MAG TPA: ribonuclease HII, partial [Nitrosopumilaceae archaeon]|nr:ribonuclease HII [Nitrosopumilaceae archaeon]